MTDDELLAKLEALEKARKACPPGEWAIRSGDGGREVVSTGTDGKSCSLTFDGPTLGALAPRINVMVFMTMAANEILPVIARLKESESILRDMADIDGYPIAMIRKYREALTRIANLDPRAINPRHTARKALEAYPLPEEISLPDPVRVEAAMKDIAAGRVLTARECRDELAARRKQQ